MNRPFDEPNLQAALHAALDDLPVIELSADEIADSARRQRRARGSAAGAALLILMILGTAALTFPQLARHGHDGSSSSSGYVPSSPDPAPPPGAEPRTPAPSTTPATPKSTPPSTPPSSVPATHNAPPATKAGVLCPQPQPSGVVNYPPALDKLMAGGTAWDSPADGLPVPFAATRAIVCRYDHDGMRGAADVTDRAVAKQLRDGVNSASTLHTNEECPGEMFQAYVIFTTGTRGQFLSIDLTDCYGWMQPSSYLLPQAVSRQMLALTKDGAGM
jgi:hypothetical protein